MMLMADRMSGLLLDVIDRHPGVLVGTTAAVSGAVLGIAEESGIPAWGLGAGTIGAVASVVAVCARVLLTDIAHLRARISELEMAERERAVAMDVERADLIARIRQLEDLLRGDGR